MSRYEPKAFPVQVESDFVAQHELRSNGTECPTSTSGYGTRSDGRAAEGPGGRRYNGRRPILYDAFDEVRAHPGEPAYRHEAQDITCAVGSYVVSPVYGRVPTRFAHKGQWLPGVGSSPKGGNYAWVVEPDGTAHYFAHMLEPARIRVGETVYPNQIIGLCGRTGNARGGCAHLHYAVTDPDGRKIRTYAALLALYQADGWLRPKSVVPVLVFGGLAVGGFAWWRRRQRAGVRRRSMHEWP